jgi:hypothetical protein
MQKTDKLRENEGKTKETDGNLNRKEHKSYFGYKFHSVCKRIMSWLEDSK